MKDDLPSTFLHEKEWLTKVPVDSVTWFTRAATKEEIEAAKAYKVPTEVVVNGKALPWRRPDNSTWVAGDPLPRSIDVDRGT